MRRYSTGLDVLGAEPVTNRALLIRVRNADELARSQGALAAFAQGIAPASIEGKVYEELAKQLQDGLRKNHVDAVITVVEPSKFQTADGKHIAQDVAIGIAATGGVVAGLALLWKFLGSHRR